MKFSDAVRQIMLDTDTTTTEAARKIGLSVPAFCGRLRRPDTGLLTASDTLSALGYQLVIMPKEAYIDKNCYPLD